jgi:tRNA-dihydrouridine synthase B
MLASLEGYSDSAFRTLCHRHGADMTFTEMAHVESFLRGSRPTLGKISVRDSTPVQIQILTGREDHLERFICGFESFQGFMGFNLNLSCPSREVIRQGKGAAMIKRVTKTQRLVALIKNHGYPVSVKIRIGANTIEKKSKVYLNSLREVDADFFVVHAKTATQESSEGEDYSVFPECVDAAGKKLLIANGGIDSAEKVLTLQEMGVGGVMIGRAALSNPALFDILRNELSFNSPLKPIPRIKELREEYTRLQSDFQGQLEHRENVLKVMGKDVGRVYY